MANEREFRIYISSTVDDLAVEREMALRIASKHGTVLMTRRADVVPVVKACIDDVRSSDLYIGIVGLRYGWQPEIESNPERKSITELEYEACGDTIPRLVFVKEGAIKPNPPHQDLDTKLIRAFRTRVMEGTKHTAFPFDDDDKANEQKHFALKLDQALAAVKADFRRRWSDTGGAMGGGGRPRKDLLRAVALVGVAGDDDAAIEVARKADDPGFVCTTLRLDELNWSVELDRRLRAAQSACLLLTRAGIDRLRDAKKAAIASALTDARRCARPAFLVLAGLKEADLPACWSDGVVIEVDAPPWSGEGARRVLGSVIRGIDNREPRIDPVDNAELDALRQRLYYMAAVRSPHQKVALPIVIATPDRAEIASLLKPDRPGFSAYADKSERRNRRDDFIRVERGLDRVDPDWANQSYREERLLARCFGPKQPPVLELVLATIEGINDAIIGTRERRLLPHMRIVPRLYRFDDLVSGGRDRSSVLLDAASMGALVVIDELSLLHPRLLCAVKPLLDLPRTAAVAIGASDPTHSNTNQLLSNASFLNVGRLLQRFVTERDLRCEIAINSVQRLERWIRIVVPEMLSLGDAGEASAELVRKSSEVLGPTAGFA